MQLRKLAIEIKIVHNLVFAQFLIEEKAMEEWLISFDIRCQKWIKSLLSSPLIHLNLYFIWKNELGVLFHIHRIIVHRKQNVRTHFSKKDILFIFIIFKLFHEFLLTDASYHEIFNKPLRNLLTCRRILHAYSISSISKPDIKPLTNFLIVYLKKSLLILQNENIL